MVVGAKPHPKPFPVASQIIQRRWDQNYLNIHYRKVIMMKGTVDMSSPREYFHLQHRLKQEQEKEDQMNKIKRENDKMLEKISWIMRQKQRADGVRLQKPRSHFEIRRKRELIEITRENQRLLRRTLNVKSRLDNGLNKASENSQEEKRPEKKKPGRPEKMRPLPKISTTTNTSHKVKRRSDERHVPKLDLGKDDSDDVNRDNRIESPSFLTEKISPRAIRQMLGGHGRPPVMQRKTRMSYHEEIDDGRGSRSTRRTQQRDDDDVSIGSDATPRQLKIRETRYFFVKVEDKGLRPKKLWKDVDITDQLKQARENVKDWYTNATGEWHYGDPREMKSRQSRMTNDAVSHRTPAPMLAINETGGTFDE